MIAGIAEAEPSFLAEACPVADGGEGTMQTLIGAMGGSIHKARVAGPLGEPVEAQFGIAGDGKTAIVELAEASGLTLVPRQRRDPTMTTTFGTGQLIQLAAERGCTTIIVCIGGSATVDGGAGMIQALGGRFFDSAGRLITEPLTGGGLTMIARIEPPRDLPILRVACDVTNPLCGSQGAAAVYGPQKGATPAQVRRLDATLAHFASLTKSDPNLAGAGAAGGAGFGLVVLCGAKLERGIELVLDVIGFERRCQGAALVLTGEGRLDSQSLAGKACMGVAAAASRAGMPTIAIVGSTGPGFEACLDRSRGGLLRSCASLSDRFGVDRAMKEPAAALTALTAEVVRDLMR